MPYYPSDSSADARQFSEDRHRGGAWNTRVSSPHNPLVRALGNFMSFKRSGVSYLARQAVRGSRGLDIGGGNGAYAAWFSGINPGTIVTVDWSLSALRSSAVRRHRGSPPRILRVCADARRLPFRARTFNFFYTVDCLGHIENPDLALDEILRTSQPQSPFFIHSECCDYRRRWPDSALMKKLGQDYLAEYDGHRGLRSSPAIYKSLIARMHVSAFYSPAGIFGWLLGYPEKYRIAFRRAGWRLCSIITLIFTLIKKTPVLGIFLRLVNAVSNRLELFFGIVGGGSCFALGYVLPEQPSGTLSGTPEYGTSPNTIPPPMS